MARRKVPPPLESREDSYIRRLYRTAGCTVVTFAQPGRTRQTPGIPDMLVFSPRTNDWWWHEVKRQRGPSFLVVSHGQTPEQAEFQRLVEGFGHRYLIGARDVAKQQLVDIGLITEVA